LRLAQLCLLDLALRRTPIPDGNIERGDDGRTEIRNSIRPGGEVSGVNAVKIIEAEGRQITSARGYDVVARLLDCCKSSAEIRVVTRGALLDFGKRRQSEPCMQIVGEVEIVVEVREDQNSEVKPRV